MKFLENVVNEVIKIPDFYKDIFLFPNKRSVVFFEKYLKNQIENPLLFPYTKDLREFVFEIIELNKLDNFNLTFEFFEVYQKIFHNENFENFFMWSQILLKDFEEIDFSNRSSKEILKNISELQKIEGYVESFGLENPTEFRNKFFYFWDKLCELYQNFVTHIVKNKKSAYYGYALKYLNQKLKTQNITIKGRNIYFIGFSDFQNSELELISLLKDRVKFYFDVDEFFFYQENEKSEIARLFLKTENKLQITIEKESFINNHSLKIYLVPCKNSVEQFKFCHSILKHQIKVSQSIDLEEFSIILNDSSNLEVLLNSFPEELNSINITLGFPLEKTYLTKIILELMELKVFRYTTKFQELLVKIIHYPYIQHFFDENEKQKISEIPFHEPLSFENINFLQEVSFIKKWLEIQSFSDIVNFLQNWITELKNQQPISFNEIENQELYYNFLFLTKLKKHSLKINHQEISWKTLFIIFKQLIQTEYIPFNGEPLKGLQVMELTESQCLDFRKVFLMNVNEGVLPKSADFSSFIPMEIKRAYGLRTPEDFDARFAYLFYRLFHRAEEVYLFYNQNDDEEESRFIKQVEILFSKFSNIQIETLHFRFPPKTERKINPIFIEKNNEIISKTYKKLTEGIAPTALITYLLCPLKFYYTYIEKIKPIDEFEEDLMANEFGTIAHDSLEEIYQSMNTNKLVKTLFEFNSNILNNWLEKNLQKISQIVKEKFETHVKHKSEEGKNYFLLKVIETIIHKIIQKDIERLENQKMKIYGLEKEIHKEFKIDGKKVILKGFIDRIEWNGDYYQIIDYKSGRIGKTHFVNLDAFSEEQILKHKEAFQLMFYSMLLYHELPAKEKSKKIYSGIYSFRSLEKGLLNLENEEKTWLDYHSVKNDFENFIESKIKDLLNPTLPFIQTSNENNCKYCPFLKNCGKFYLLNG